MAEYYIFDVDVENRDLVHVFLLLLINHKQIFKTNIIHDSWRFVCHFRQVDSFYCEE